MSDLLANIAGLSPEKRELLLRRLEKKRAAQVTSSKPQAISAQKRWTGPIPLSFTQQRLWFIHQLNPESHAYNIPRSLRLKGSLNVAALEKSFNEIVRRHEVLRTSYPVIDGGPSQDIAQSLTLTLPITDLREIPESERFDKALELAAQMAVRPFDLSRGPVLRVSLMRLGEQDHLLLVIMHHVITDVWSLGVFFREMALLYDNFCGGNTASLEELPIQYADYATWQRHFLQGETLENLGSYWKTQLEGKLPVMQLPTDRPRPAAQTFRGTEVLFTLPQRLTDELKALSQREGVTLFMTLLAAFNTLLYLYSRQEDIIVGSPIANRSPVETERLIGFFANTVVFRTDLSNAPTFKQLLRQVREVALGVYSHQDLPFEKLVEIIQPERSASHTVVFQVLFALQNTAIPDLKLSGLDVNLVPIESGNSRFDLALHLTDWPEGLVGLLEYSTDLFDAATITRMVEHFNILLEEVVANPNQSISTLPILTDAERRALIEWNNTRTGFQINRQVHELIEAQVERTPGSIAVAFENQEVSYHELNSRANQLARRLQAIGVGPEALVGIYMERSLEMVVGILGTMKAGGAYLPLEPALPEHRLDFILRDTAVSAVLTQSHLIKSLPGQLDHRICLDSEWESGEEYDDSNLCAAVADENLAYVIYTSGSTGHPKGVMSTHAGLRNRLLWMHLAYNLSHSDRVLQKTPFSFDVSVWEFFWPLMTGATLVVARPAGHQDPAYLIDLIRHRQITTLHFVPSMLRLFLQEDGLESLTTLRQVICSGEALSFDLKQKFFNRLKADLHNLYGPTEASIDVTYYNCREDDTRGTVPIGKPIANTQIHILNEHLQPTPLKVAGELYIGGIGLARGYVNRPDLTAERFVPNPFGDEPGGRLYKTGDLARWLEDGNVEYLGRIDFQVKVRGFRIELGEIEAALVHHQAIKEAVVVALEDNHGDKRLIAYLVTNRQEGISTSELRGFLQETLPEYMIPSAFVVLDSLPLTPSGKVDRKALPAPGQARAGKSFTYVAPRTSTEKTLSSIWGELLGVEGIGIHDDFFDLGGHSLLGIQLMWRLRRQFCKNLPVTTLFTARTVAELARLLEDQDSQPSPPSALVVIRAGRIEPPLFFIHPAGGQVLGYHHLAAALETDRPMYGLQSRALGDAETEHASVEEMAEEYAAAISEREPSGPYYLLGWSMGGVIAVSIAGIFERQGKRVAFVGLFDSHLQTAAHPGTENPIDGLALVFGGVMAEAFAAMDQLERQVMLERFAALPAGEQVRQAVAWGRERDLIASDISMETVQHQMALASTHTRLLGAHSAPIIQAPIRVWWARDRIREGRPRTDWSRHTAGGVLAEVAEGNHFTMLRPPHCQAIAARLRECLKQSYEREASIGFRKNGNRD